VAILGNSAFVAWTSDWEIKHVGKKPPSMFLVMEYAFLAFFLFELLLRILVHRAFFFCKNDFLWNIFDFTVVVATCVGEAIALVQQDKPGHNMSFIRLIRLFKIAKILRVFRTVRIFRDLSHILEAFQKTLYTLFWSFMALLLLLYVFALILLTGVSAALEEGRDDRGGRYEVVTDTQTRGMNKYFGSLGGGMLSLFMAVTGGDDWAPIYSAVKDTGRGYALVFLGFIFFFTMAVVTVLTGIVVEKAVQSGMPDRDELMMEKRSQLLNEAAIFRQFCASIDKNNTGNITLAQFKESMEDPDMAAFMAAVGLEEIDVNVFFQTVARNAEALDIEHMVHGCLMMRGPATSLDMHRQLYVSECLRKKLDQLEDLCKGLV
jgi:hypothetical protein